jgi:hypothetical protein
LSKKTNGYRYSDARGHKHSPTARRQECINARMQINTSVTGVRSCWQRQVKVESLNGHICWLAPCVASV